MKKSYRIEVSDHFDQIVYYPRELKIDTVLTKVAFGTFSHEVACKPHKDGRNTVTLSPDVAKALAFPSYEIPLHVFVDEQTLHIGPLIGIFTSGFTPFAMKPIGERSSFFAKLLSVHKSVGAMPFVFGEQHINWDNGTIDALTYQEHGWETLTLPFPNVIYDRLPNRRSEKKSSSRIVKERLQNDYLIPWYNPGFFNKLDVYERLHAVYNVGMYLPETHPFHNIALVERMLGQYGHVYIKPINGSLGLGIHQIVYDREQQVYYCRYRDDAGQNRLTKFDFLVYLSQ